MFLISSAKGTSSVAMPLLEERSHHHIVMGRFPGIGMVFPTQVRKAMLHKEYYDAHSANYVD